MKKINLIIINFLVFIVLIIFLELIFGNWIKKNNFGYFIRELRNIEIPMSVKYQGDEYNYLFKRNDLGFIGEKKDAEKIKILFLGGSTGEQMFIPPKFTIVEQLNNRFNRENQNIEIINASKGGKSTRGYVNDFLYWFPKIKNFNPKIIIFYIGLNDSTLKLPKHFDELDKKNNLGKVEDFLKNNSAIYRLKKKIENKYFNPLRIYYGLEQKNLYDKFNYINYTNAYKKFNKRKKNDENTQVINNFNNNIENLKNVIIHKNLNPIFITQIRYDGVSDFNLFLINEKLKEFCKKNNFDIIKLDEIINTTEKNDFYDEVHTTIAGSTKISEYIYPQLKEILIKNEK